MKFCRQLKLAPSLDARELEGNPPRAHSVSRLPLGTSRPPSGPSSRKDIRPARDSPDCWRRSAEADPKSRKRPHRPSRYPSGPSGRGGRLRRRWFCGSHLRTRISPHSRPGQAGTINSDSAGGLLSWGGRSPVLVIRVQPPLGRSSGQIVAVGVHDFVPGRDEVSDKFRLGVGAGIDFG